jgi:hypothetical protein
VLSRLSAAIEDPLSGHVGDGEEPDRPIGVGLDIESGRTGEPDEGVRRCRRVADGVHDDLLATVGQARPEPRVVLRVLAMNAAGGAERSQLDGHVR